MRGVSGAKRVETECRATIVFLNKYLSVRSGVGDTLNFFPDFQFKDQEIGHTGSGTLKTLLVIQN